MKRKTKPKDTAINKVIRFPPEFLEEVEAIARKTGFTFSEFTRDALREKMRALGWEPAK